MREALYVELQKEGRASLTLPPHLKESDPSLFLPLHLIRDDCNLVRALDGLAVIGLSSQYS
jgi:hypothetical protein